MTKPVCVCVCAQSCPTLCDPVDYIAHQVPLSMGLHRQEYWSGLPFPSPNHSHREMDTPVSKGICTGLHQPLLYHL